MEENYTIGQLAKRFNITTNKIRFYEKKGLINPQRIESSGYRIYTKNNIDILQSILLYRSVGLTIDSIGDIINNKNRKTYLSNIHSQWKVVNDEISRLTNIRNSLEYIIDAIYEGEENEEYNINLPIDKEESIGMKAIKQWNDKWDFNSWAESYDRDVVRDISKLKIYSSYNTMLNKVVKIVRDIGSSNPSILEIGVGTGNLANRFLELSYNIIGIDQSREMLWVAKEKHPNLKLRLGDFINIPYPDNWFSVIVSTYAFHHLSEDEKVLAIQEMLRVLKDNGTIIIGDIMFENNKYKEYILKDLSHECKIEVDNEYFPIIEILTKEFEKYNKELKYIKLDKLSYIVVIK